MLTRGQFRFTPAHRLKDASAYGQVFKKARRSRDKYFTVLYRPRRSPVPRLGLAISRKHCRKAADRNRIKRVIRESFRHSKQTLGGVDIVVINNPPAARATNAELFASLDAHWHRCSTPVTAPDRETSDG